MTSAPASARSAQPAGAASQLATSSTRIPASGPPALASGTRGLRRNGDLQNAFGLTAKEVVRLGRLVQRHPVREEGVQVDLGILDKREQALHARTSGRAERRHDFAVQEGR